MKKDRRKKAGGVKGNLRAAAGAGTWAGVGGVGGVGGYSSGVSTLDAVRASLLATARHTRQQRTAEIKLRGLMHDRLLRLVEVKRVCMEGWCEGLPVDGSLTTIWLHVGEGWKEQLLVAMTMCDDWTWLMKEGAGEGRRRGGDEGGRRRRR